MSGRKVLSMVRWLKRKKKEFYSRLGVGVCGCVCVCVGVCGVWCVCVCVCGGGWRRDRPLEAKWRKVPYICSLMVPFASTRSNLLPRVDGQDGGNINVNVHCKMRAG